MSSKKKVIVPEFIVRAGAYAISIYVESIRKGNSRAMAEMFALRSPPGLVTDCTFLANRGTLASQFQGDEGVMADVIAAAKRNGYTPNANDVYLSQLAAFPGDPAAFVPATGGRGHVQKVCEDRGWACEGSVKTKAREQEKPTENIKLGTDLVESNVDKMVKKNPDLKRVDRRDLRAEAIAKHGMQGK